MYKKRVVFIALFLLFNALISVGAPQMSNELLTVKQQHIIPIAAFTANGQLAQLKEALKEGLDSGLTINEIKEVLVQMYAYAGFPRSLNGITTFMQLLDERQQKGIRDEQGKDADPLPANKSSIELGTEVQTYLIGAPATGAALTFAPTIDQFLKGHLFGDIFGRNNLDYQSREIATIAALSSITGVESQLQSHLRMGMNIGLTESQIKDVINILHDKVGASQASTANQALLDISK